MCYLPVDMIVDLVRFPRRGGQSHQAAHVLISAMALKNRASLHTETEVCCCNEVSNLQRYNISDTRAGLAAGGFI